MRLHFARLHVRQRRQRRVERAPEVGGHRILEVVDGHVLERPDLDDAGVVDQHVDAAAIVGDPLDGPLDLRPIAEVALDRRGLAAQRLDVGGGPLELLFVARGQDDVRALGRERPRHRQAESARPAGDEHGRAGEVDGPPCPQRLGGDQRAERGANRNPERSLQPHPHTSASAPPPRLTSGSPFPVSGHTTADRPPPSSAADRGCKRGTVGAISPL